MTAKNRDPTWFASATVAAGLVVWQACAGNPNIATNTGKSQTLTDIQQQSETSQGLAGTRVSFHNADYYSLTQPKPETNCAGDARIFYDPLLPLNAQAVTDAITAGFAANSSPGSINVPLSLPSSLPLDALDANRLSTIHPSFIKNVSVDLTDANAPTSTNLAFACSLGAGPNVPPVSHCATFDYGAIGGIPTNMGGSLLLIGGIQSINYSGILPTAALRAAYHDNGHSVSCGPVGAAIAPSNFASGTECDATMFAISINSLPMTAATDPPSSIAPGLLGATGPISTWANISAASGYSGPRGIAGGAAAYDEGIQRILIHGGASPYAGMGPTGPGVTTFDTWTFDLKTQAWALLNSKVFVDTAQQTVNELADNFGPLGGQTLGPAGPGFAAPGGPIQFSKSVGTRSLFGYTSVPGMAVNQMTSDGNGFVTPSSVDVTERVVVVGGFTGLDVRRSGTHRFNPTFGPEFVDTISWNATNDGTLAPAANTVAQWMDSYHTQVMYNSFSSSTTIRNPSVYLPYFPASSSPSDFFQSVAFGLLPLVEVPNTGTLFGRTPFGYLLAVGGFNATQQPVNLFVPNTGPCSSTTAGTTTIGTDIYNDPVTPGTPNNDLTHCGQMLLNYRFGGTGGRTDGSLKVSNFLGLPNMPDGTMHTPALWGQVRETATTTVTVPHYGASVAAIGPSRALNQVVVVGGTQCIRYLNDESIAVCDTINGAMANVSIPAGNPVSFWNPGHLWQFGSAPATGGRWNSATQSFDAAAVTDVGFLAGAGLDDEWLSVNPTQLVKRVPAGMAFARGEDGAGNVILVAYGGVFRSAKQNTDSSIYYMHASGAQGRWRHASPTSGPPVVPSNSAMVYSHITRKFYMFGGYFVASNLTNGDTWELGVTGNCAAGSCTFTWKQLNGSGGLTCYPNCPPIRRSHRMVETNYNFHLDADPTLATINSASLEPDCTNAGAPCSFGIFMEGGTPDGFNLISDRWMFDPTANGGNGHWQNVTAMPPRSLAALAPVDYYVKVRNSVVHRAIMFGGETALHSPPAASASATGAQQYFVAPTLGDTWMYDYDTNSWNRVTLLGKGYNTSLAPLNSLSTLNEFEARQAYAAKDNGATQLAVLSPPALSGGIMVARTQNAIATGTSCVRDTKPVKIPQLFLLGGRTKDGRVNTLDKVYKFCAGTTGEKPWNNGSNKSQSGRDIASSGPVTTDDASCDAFDGDDATPINPNAPGPTDTYVGRWTIKSPAGTNTTSSGLGSFLGAGTYDPVDDLIVVMGGLKGSGGANAVTDRSSGNILADAQVYEYSPPCATYPHAGATSAMLQGAWTFIRSCDPVNAPVARYGHSMGYDTLNQQLMVIGGFDGTGNPLTQNLTYYDGRTYSVPEVWAGKRLTANDPANGIVASPTNPCYSWSQIKTFGNSLDIQSGVPPLAGLAHATSVYVPATGFNTGYYAMFDNACEKAGPIVTTDASVNKLLAGGAYFDIDRSQLGQNENLLLTLTYIPLGQVNRMPDNTPVTAEQSAFFKVHLVKTGQNGDTIRQVFQPRYLTYAAVDQFPQVAQTISVLAPPSGQARQEQLYLPISIDPGIDRIRIERVSGSGILIDATIMRMGHK